MENYIILEKIGEGSFGRVYRGRRKYTGQIVALKFVAKRGKTPRDIANLRQEINILRRLNHCNIIAILDSFETDGEFCMVTEYGLGELFEVLQGDLSLPEAEIRHITIQLLQALQVLHSMRIIHRDMKPQNILIGSKQQIKLCDFGFARAISQESSVLTSIKGTPLYMAPELVQEKPYNCTVDLWSLGVILYELAVGTPPFYTDRFVTLVDMIIKQPVTFPDTMSPPFRSFLAGLLTKDPQKRLTWPHILNHEFVVETPEELQRRLQLEQACQQLPRFFSSAEHVPVESNQPLRPSVERLRNSGEWNICDPETGRRIQNVVPAPQVVTKETTKGGAPKQVESRGPRVPDMVSAPVLDAKDYAMEFMKSHKELAQHVQGKKGLSVIENAGWSRLLDAFLMIPSTAMDAECVAAATSDMVIMYKALGAIMKSINQVQSVGQILTARGIVHKFIEGYLRQDLASRETSADLFHQAVRSCTMFTNVINSLDPALVRSMNYHDFCSSDLRLVTKILRLSGDQFNAALSKTLKWLGSMLDRSRNLTDFLEEVQPSDVIEALCEVLASSSGKRSPGGTSTKSARDLGLYAVFALATFVHPDGSKWGPLHSFPVMTLRGVEDERDENAADVHHLYKLRVKIHGEVTTQLLRSGLQELLALLNDEFKSRVARRHAGEDDDGEEEPDQSTVSCVIKILLHACRSSSPLSKKIMASKTARTPSPNQQDIITVVVGLIQSGTLHDLEMYFAVEFLVVLIRRQVLSKPHVWHCAKVLYPIFLSTSDVGLLSLCSTYYSDVLESSSMDTSALSREEQALGLEIGDQNVWNLVLHGVLPEACGDSVLRLLHHADFAALSHQDRLDKLQVLSCYNVRAQGLADAGVVLLLRIAAKALSQAATSDVEGADTRALHSFMRLFESPTTWDLLRKFLGDCGDNLMSPWGLFCFLKLIRMVREMPTSDLVVEMQLNQHLVPHLVNLLQTGHMQSLFKWPEVVAGGRNAVKALIHAIVKVLGIPFMHSQSDELLISTQETLYDSMCVQKLLTVLHYVFTSPDFGLDESLLELPMSFLSRLVTSSEHFGSQFVQAGGVATIKVCEMLSNRSSPSLMIDTLLIISQLARSSPENYEGIRDSGLLTEFRDMVNHSEAMVRAKALNCIGNLCRHSTLFYDSFSTPISGADGSLSVLDGVVSGLSDADAYVRRFACFAIGNAAFHNSQLYASLRMSIAPLVQNLHDDDEKTRSNAAGALGNLVRNSDELCGEMCRHHAPLELFELALTDPSISSRRIVLFSLGNFCAYGGCVESIEHEEPDFTGQLERLYEDVAADEMSKRNIRRIMTKVDGLRGIARTET